MKYNFRFGKQASETEEFKEASANELKVLVALYESCGSVEDSAICEKTGISKARVVSSLSLWQEAGVIVPVDEREETPYGNTVSEEFEEKNHLEELEEQSAAEIAVTIRNKKLASLFDECAVMMNKAMLTPAEIRRISALSSQYGLSEEYIATLAAHLAAENMLSVGILVKRAITLVGNGVANVESLESYIACKEKEKNDFIEYKRIFGIYNRSLSKKEVEYIRKWSVDYCFGVEIVSLAYDISTINTSKLSFAYMDTLLTDWYESACCTLDDCEKRYVDYKRERDAAEEENRKQAAARRPEKRKPLERYGDFDPEEAFKLAISRSFSQDSVDKD